MRPVFCVAGGVSKFAKARKDKTFQALVREAVDEMCQDLRISHRRLREVTDETVLSYFSDHFTGQLKAGSMVHDYLGFCPAGSHRVEGGGATGGLCFQEAYKTIASGAADICLACGFETMSSVLTWKGNEFIALASDVTFDFPVGGFYSGYYAAMVTRHMKEFGTTVEQMAMVSVKNHRNAVHNPYAQHAGLVDLGNGEKVRAADLTVADVLRSVEIAWPLKRLDICTMSDGAAACLLASEKGLRKLQRARARIPALVKVSGIGRGQDTMRLADRPRGEVILLPHEDPELYRGLKYPGVHSFRAGRVAAKQAYERAGITDPLCKLDFVELHDAYTSSEIQTVEDLGLAPYGRGGAFIESGLPFMQSIRYGDGIRVAPARLPVNPSGGLIACGHPVGATGLMQAVFALWQLQRTIRARFGSDVLQVPGARCGLIHSHAGTGSYVAVSVLERVDA